MNSVGRTTAAAAADSAGNGCAGLAVQKRQESRPPTNIEHTGVAHMLVIFRFTHTPTKRAAKL